MSATLKLNTGDKMFDVEPAISGVTESYEKIWSENTGRSSNGKMTGDIIATKLKLAVKYPILNNTQKKQLNKAVSDAFFKVTYLDKEYTMYASSPEYPLYSVGIDGIQYVGVGVDLIEQ